MEDSIPNITTPPSESTQIYPSHISGGTGNPTRSQVFHFWKRKVQDMNVKTKNETVFIADLDIYEI